MLVRRIEEFISDLQGLANLMHYDSAILDSLIQYFSSKDNDRPLSDADLEFIKNHFNQRCALIAEVSDVDYTSHPTPVNIFYVALAKDLAEEQNISYLKILYPTVVNTQDPNDFSKLANAPIDTLFWFGNAQGVPTLLYSISGLANQVIHSHTLSTRRELLGPLCALTIHELSQLRRFRGRAQAFIFETKSYVNFWDFLEIELFGKLNPPPQMIAQLPDISEVDASRASDATLFLATERIRVLYSARQQLPAHLFSRLIPPLLFLTEQCARLGNPNHNFQHFKSISEFIFRTISAFNLNDINRIYLAKILHKGRKICFLDLLINIYNAKDVDIKDTLLILREWLAPFKLHLPSSNSPLLHFKALIVSLFLIDFRTLRPTLDSIALYDQPAFVFRDAKALYSEVDGLIQSNDLIAINELFPRLKIKYIKAFLDGTNDSIMIKKLAYPSRVVWYNHVNNNTLSELGIHWEEPELLAHVMVHPMLQFLSIDTGTHLKIKNFLDELIRTYIQPSELINDLQREFRVNILFNRLLKNISDDDKKSLYVLIDVFRGVHVKDLFMSNCVRHMYQTIDSFSVSAFDLAFFSRASHFARDRAALQHHNMREAADALKRHNLPREAIMYLNKLTEPFLSVAVTDAISDANATRVDSLGAPS